MTLLRVMAVLLTVCPTISPASAIDLAGNVERLQGSAHATSAAGLSRPLRIGSTILVSDQVSTGTGTRLLLRMNDGAALALGAGTTLTIAVYDEDGSSSKAVLGLDHGVLAVTTGAIGRLGPERFAINTPVAFLEIQGRELLVDALPDRLALALMRDGAVTATTVQGSVKLTQAETGVDIVLGEGGLRRRRGGDPSACKPRVWPSRYRKSVADAISPSRLRASVRPSPIGTRLRSMR